MNEISIGLWKVKSDKGTEYYRGVKDGVEINDKRYRVSLFENTNKKSDKSPAMTIKLKEFEIKEETQQEPQEVNEFSTMSVKTDYQETPQVQLNDNDLPF